MPDTIPLFLLLADRGLAPSNGEARRLVRAGLVSVAGVVVADEGALVPPGCEITIAHGRRFA